MRAVLLYLRSQPNWKIVSSLTLPTTTSSSEHSIKLFCWSLRPLFFHHRVIHWNSSALFLPLLVLFQYKARRWNCLTFYAFQMYVYSKQNVFVKTISPIRPGRFVMLPLHHNGQQLSELLLLFVLVHTVSFCAFLWTWYCTNHLRKIRTFSTYCSTAQFHLRPFLSAEKLYLSVCVCLCVRIYRAMHTH